MANMALSFYIFFLHFAKPAARVFSSPWPSYTPKLSLVFVLREGVTGDCWYGKPEQLQWLASDVNITCNKRKKKKKKKKNS
jgi:hypothetical protein